jgi:drug/metabolite transporter (DMT)-like permease
MRPERTAGAGLALAVLSAFTFGTSGTFAHSLIDAGWSPAAAVTARVGIAAVLLGVPAAWALRGRWAVLRRNAGMVATYGVLAVAGAQVAFFNAVQYVPVGVALLLEYLGIVLVVGWMWAVHGQRPTTLTLAGAVVSLGGLAFVLDLGGGGHADIRGVVWGLVAAVGLAGYYVLSARVDPALPSVTMASTGMAAGALLLVALGLLGAVPMHATFGDVTFAGHRTSWLVPIAGLSVVAATIAYVAGIGAARILGARLSSFAGLTEVLFAVLIAWLLLGELPAGIQLLGGVLILGGVALVRAGEPRNGTEPREAAEPEARAVAAPEVVGTAP